MKTILVPVDYSENSKNAFHYAIDLAEISKSKIILFHVFEVPVTMTDMPVVIMTPDELAKINISKLNDIKQKILAKHSIEIEVESVPGYAISEIVDRMKRHDIDITVMGIKGVSKLTEIIIGSITTGVIQKANKPVLVVHEHARFKAIDKILIANDNTPVSNKSFYNILKDFTDIFNSEVKVLNVVKEKDLESSVVTITIEFRDYLKGINLTEHIIQAEDFYHGIHDFMDQNSTDLVVTIPHKHKFFERFTHESNTKKLAFHTYVPLLAIPDSY